MQLEKKGVVLLFIIKLIKFLLMSNFNYVTIKIYNKYVY